MTKVSKEINEITHLSEKLKKSDKVKKFDSNKEPCGWRIAYSLREIEESSSKIFTELLKKLEKSDDQKEIDEILFDIGEELRHIVYHIKDSKYFDYVLDFKEHNPR